MILAWPPQLKRGLRRRSEFSVDAPRMVVKIVGQIKTLENGDNVTRGGTAVTEADCGTCR